MDKIVSDIVNLFTRQYGYTIIEANFLEAHFWGVSREYENITNEIFFSDLESFSEIKQLITLKNKQHIKSIIIVVDSFDNDKALKLYEEPNTVAIDIITKSIIFSNTDMSSLQDILRDLLLSNNPGRKTGKPKPIMTYSLIAINLIVYMISAILSNSIFDININVLINLGAKYNELIAEGQFYRLFTSMFLHAGLIHIGLNMISLNAIGPLVENIYGKYKYITLYLISGVVAALSSFAFSDSVSVGASGAIFGILGAVLVFSIKMKKNIGRNLLTNVISVIAINLMLGFSISNVDNYAHIGGLIAGVIFATALFPKIEN